MEKRTSKKGPLIALAVLVVVLAAALAVYFSSRPAAVPGGKHITVQVIHGDGSTKDFSVNTEQEFLDQALVEGGIVEDNQDQFGLYILTADGVTADESKQEWWNVCKDGEPLQVGAGSQPIADGEHYELVFTVGYDF